MASMALVIALALFVLSQPPQIENERRSEQQGFSQLTPNYLGFSDPQIAQLENNIYFVWDDITREKIEDLYFIWSSNNGLAFSASENLSDTPGNSTNPQIAAYGNSTYVVWEDDTNGNDEI